MCAETWRSKLIAFDFRRKDGPDLLLMQLKKRIPLVAGMRHFDRHSGDNARRR
jgi:hypothetical protein